MAIDLRPFVETSERRKLQRLPARDAAVTSTAGELDLVNLCPTGMAVSGRVPRSLDVGQQHFFVVQDRGQTFELTGEVRWLKPDQTGRSAAGIAFTEILRADTRGLWAGVTRHR